jgi:hypothetical protein
LSYLPQYIEPWPPWSCFRCLHMVRSASWDGHVWWQSTHRNTFAFVVSTNKHFS